MNKRGASEQYKPSIIMVSVFIMILIAYLAYIFLLNPWERRALLTTQANLTVNVIDCNSGLPINNARIKLLNQEGGFVSEGLTTNGVITFTEIADCYNIKASFSNDQYKGICLYSGDSRSVNFCFDYPMADPNLLFVKSDLGFIGAVSGNIITTKPFNDFVLSYPISSSSRSYPSAFLYSNIFWSEGAGFLISNVDTSLTKDLTLMFTLESKRGTPEVKVTANNELLFRDSVVTGEVVRVKVPKQALNKTIDFEVKCDFTGFYFWSTQDCNLTNISVVQEFYTPKKVSEPLTFSTSKLERDSSELLLNFSSTGSVVGGVKALVNSVLVFDSNSLSDKTYSAVINASTVNLTATDNSLEFIANPGAEAWLSNVSLSFLTPYKPVTSKELSFNISDSKLKSVAEVSINLLINNLLVGSELRVKVNDVYYVSVLDKSGWVSLPIDIEDLKNDNTLVISAPKGRFEVEELRVTYE